MASRHSKGSQIGEPSLAVVRAIEPRPRPGISNLLALTSELDSVGLAVLKQRAGYALARNPRYPVNLSIATVGYSRDVVEILKLAEMVSDIGLAELLKGAAEIATEYPRNTATSATILQVVRK